MPVTALTESELSVFIFAEGTGMNTPTAASIRQTLTDIGSVQGSALIIGGLAVIHHGYKRLTEDIDLLYAQSDGTILKRLKAHFKTIVKAKSPLNYSGLRRQNASTASRLTGRVRQKAVYHRAPKSGWHHLQHRKTGVRLELIPEGGMTHFAFIPGPATVGGENGYISFFGLVWLKLAAGRAKDDADLVELMKVRMADAKAILPKLHPDLRKRYAGFLSRARKELANDPSRRP